MATIVGVMGVSGSGKTTVGTRLADAMHCAYLEGDALHSPANVEKMSRGEPLDDAGNLISGSHLRSVRFRHTASARQAVGDMPQLRELRRISGLSIRFPN